MDCRSAAGRRCTVLGHRPDRVHDGRIIGVISLVHLVEGGRETVVHGGHRLSRLDAGC